MAAMKAVGIIPARYESTRFPGKPLAPIAGRPMIQHVYERACRAKHLDEVWIATDDARIADAARGFGAPVAMTSPDHPTGSDRLAEACQDLDCEIVVNIQGDEPLIDPAQIDACVDALLANPNIPMATLVHPAGAAIASDPHRVKVVLDAAGRALYFSRAPIPAQHTGGAGTADDAPRFLQHIGIYAYRREFLLEFVALPRTCLEVAEGLEQLRALEHGYAIQAVIIEAFESCAVDVPADIAKVEARLAASG